VDRRTGSADDYRIMRLVVIVAASLLMNCSAAEFQNLDFEMANTNNATFSSNTSGFPVAFGNIADLLPHWNVEYDGRSVESMSLTRLALDGISSSLISPDALEYYRDALRIFIGGGMFGFGIDGRFG